MKITIKVGQRFSRYVVVKKDVTRNAHWICRCDCGTIKSVLVGNLMRETKSCGCYASERIAKQNRKHGYYGTKVYKAWDSMKERCRNPNNPSYSRYGGRGITISKEWGSFETFYADMGNCPSSKHTLDRIDNNKGYSKENCRWATYKEQQNNKSNNVKITFNNETLTRTQWADRLNTTEDVINQRMKKMKWSVKRSVTQPVRRLKEPL